MVAEQRWSITGYTQILTSTACSSPIWRQITRTPANDRWKLRRRRPAVPSVPTPEVRETGSQKRLLHRVSSTLHMSGVKSVVVQASARSAYHPTAGTESTCGTGAHPGRVSGYNMQHLCTWHFETLTVCWWLLLLTLHIPAGSLSERATSSAQVSFEFEPDRLPAPHLEVCCEVSHSLGK